MAVTGRRAAIVSALALGLVGSGCGPAAEPPDADGPVRHAAERLSFVPYLPYPAPTTMGVSQGWGGTWSHTGDLYYAIDFNLAGTADYGIHVLAVAAGTVTYRYEDCTCEGCSCNSGWGNAIVVDHGNGEFSKYTHLGAGSIPDWMEVGTTVCQGLHVGDIGSTGQSTGPHLHFQFQNGGTLSAPSIPFDRFVETAGVPEVGGSYTSQNPEVAECGTVTGCSIVIGAGTTIVDDQTDCFVRSGQYWWEEPFGHDDHHWYTYTIDEPSPDCTASWEANVADAGNFLVEVFVPDSPASLTASVTYAIRHAGSESTATVDQSAHRGEWVELGTFDFAAGSNQLVRIEDDTGEPYVGADGPRLLCDAVRFTSTTGCADECGVGSRRCSGEGWQECGDFDADGCREWGGGASCEPGTLCQGAGECLPLEEEPDGGAAGSGSGGDDGVGITADNEGGCGCRLGEPRRGPGIAVGALLALAAFVRGGRVARARRARRRHPRPRGNSSASSGPRRAAAAISAEWS